MPNETPYQYDDPCENEQDFGQRRIGETCRPSSPSHVSTTYNHRLDIAIYLGEILAYVLHNPKTRSMDNTRRQLCANPEPKKRTQEHHRFTFNLEPVRSIRCRQNQLTSALSARLREYEVIGRHLPTEANPSPALYRMTIFAPNTIVAKSRYWYFLRGLKKVKKATGEIVSVKEISEKHPEKVKNFGIWVRYDSRSGTHNMYKEYRELSRTAAVESLYSDMAARHRARFRSIHILRVVEIEKTEDVKRPYIKQLMSKGLSFPLPHRTAKTTGKKIFSAKRPSTFA